MSENSDKSENDKGTSEHLSTEDIEKEIDDSGKWGYDLYPARRRPNKPTWVQIMFGLRQDNPLDKKKCERTVYDCLKTSKMVKLMTSALNSSGCNFDMRRHISCEMCDPAVTGGYDPLLNQIVVCENLGSDKGFVQSVLVHEMIHMFDYCKHNLNFTNHEHVACTEIRAANLTHCSFMSAMFQGNASVFNFKKRHQECVKSKAADSLMVARDIGREEATKIVDKVFDKCYNDLEPIGRRLKRVYTDQDKAYDEGYYYGYL